MGAVISALGVALSENGYSLSIPDWFIVLLAIAVLLASAERLITLIVLPWLGKLNGKRK